jgi:hypothetical protein
MYSPNAHVNISRRLTTPIVDKTNTLHIKPVDWDRFFNITLTLNVAKVDGADWGSGKIRLHSEILNGADMPEGTNLHFWGKPIDISSVEDSFLVVCETVLVLRDANLKICFVCDSGVVGNPYSNIIHVSGGFLNVTAC